MPKQISFTPRTMYWEATISKLPRAIEPALVSWLFRQGCWGTQEVLDFSQPDLRYIARIKPKKIIDVSAYFDGARKEEIEGRLLVWLRERVPSARVTWKIQAAQDWLHEWKKYFKTQKIAGLSVGPPWLIKNKDLSKTVIIEPGMAFGTGTHATTRFAIQMVKKVSQKKNLKNASVLDVGSGSGILAVVAERLSAKTILAIDNDPESWRECKKTFKLNKTKHCKVTEKQLSQIKSQYDVVIANIIDGILVELRKKLWGATKPGGHIILSGILTDGAKAFEKAFLAGTKGVVISEVSDEEWTSLLIHRPK